MGSEGEDKRVPAPRSDATAEPEGRAGAVLVGPGNGATRRGRDARQPEPISRLEVMGETEAAKLLPGLAKRIEAGKVDFEDLFECYYGAKPITAPEAKDVHAPMKDRQKAYLALLAPAYSAFEKHHPIEGEAWCEHIEAAAVLTREGADWDIKSNFDWSSDDKEIYPYFNRCAGLVVLTSRLPPVETATATRLIFEAYGTALEALDQRRERKDGDLSKAEIQEISNQVAEAQTYYESSATAQANTLYFLGTLWGTALSLVIYDVVSAIGALRSQTDILGPLTPLVLTFGAGAAGAVVSVMQRMGSAEGLVKNYRVPPATLRLFGMLRPLIGGFVGTAFHVLVLAGLIPLTLPADRATALYFVIGVAFLAGFSERWAKDLLGKAPAGIGSTGSDEVAIPAKQPGAN
jgi:hypothetical protein